MRGTRRRRLTLARPEPTPRQRKAPEPNYVVVWKSSLPGSVMFTRPQRDEVSATNAQRAINKVKKALAEQYADVPKWFVPLEVLRRDW